MIKVCSIKTYVFIKVFKDIFNNIVKLLKIIYIIKSLFINIKVDKRIFINKNILLFKIYGFI